MTLDRASAFATTVNYTVAGSATRAPTTPATPSTRSHCGGDTTGTIWSTRQPTARSESNETVVVTLTGGSTNGQAIALGPAPLRPPAPSTTTTRVPTASVAVAPRSVSEDGAANLVYTVTLDRASAFATTVNYT